MNYGQKLKELREYNGYSQRELAEAIGIKRSSYNQFEHQYDIIPIKRLFQIAIFYNLSIDYIFDLTNKPQYSNIKKDIDINISKNRLKEFRKENKITQVQLANLLQTAQPVIANYEKGRYLIATPFLYTICKKYKISADYLLGINDKPKYLKSND